MALLVVLARLGRVARGLRGGVALGGGLLRWAGLGWLVVDGEAVGVLDADGAGEGDGVRRGCRGVVDVVGGIRARGGDAVIAAVVAAVREDGRAVAAVVVRGVGRRGRHLQHAVVGLELDGW